MADLVPRKVGRPRLDEVDVLRAKACWRWIYARSGLSFERWETLLYPESVIVIGAKTERPRLWDRYAVGQVCPKDDGTPTCTVGRAESHLPGFRAFYQHPLWRTIKRQPLSLDEAISLMRELPSLKSHLFETMRCIAEGRDYGPFDPPLRRPFDSQTFVELLSNPSLDSAAAFLAMAHEASALCSIDYRDTAMLGFRAHVPMLRRSPEFAEIIDELTDLVDTRIGDFVLPHGNHKLQIRIFTRHLSDEELQRCIPISPD